MYINDCQLTCRNQNCDFPIHFRTPGSKSTTIIKSRHNLQFFCDYWTNLDQICKYVEKILTLNIFELKLRYLHPFRNGSVLNRLPWQCPLRNWKKMSGLRKFTQIPFIW